MKNILGVFSPKNTIEKANKFEPVIKWTGSKRHISSQIIEHFPKEIDTYYESFLGGGSIIYSLLKSNIRVKKYIASDICTPLIDLWNLIKNNPNIIISEYKKHWNNLKKDKEYFYNIRKKFNETKDPKLFFFISRTCTNGLIRFNSKGNFNNSYHLNRDGINPDRLEKILYDWSETIKDVNFLNIDYKKISPQKNDFIYLDPPYAGTKGIYYGSIDLNIFFNWLKNINCKYILSFDGKRGKDDLTYNVPENIYIKHLYLKSGKSSFSRLKNLDVEVYESIYLNY